MGRLELGQWIGQCKLSNNISLSLSHSPLLATQCISNDVMFDYYPYLLHPLHFILQDKRGLALDGQIKHEDTCLASSTM